jgi:GNAT superfamily N-acetyltransferase
MKFIELKNSEFSELNEISNAGYQLDWTTRTTPQSITIGSVIDGEIAGLVEYERQPESNLNFMHLIEVADEYKGRGIGGALLAYVGKNSLNAGFDGFVVFEPMTLWWEYYQDKYGAKPSPGRLLYFDTEATRQLIQEYLQEGELMENNLVDRLAAEWQSLPDDVRQREHEQFVELAALEQRTQLGHVIRVTSKLEKQGVHVTDQQWDDMSIL